MSDDTWTAHDVTDGRLFYYATSLWLLGMAALLLLLDLAIALGVPVSAAWLMLLVAASFGALLVGIYYNRVITGISRVILWLHPTETFEEGDRA